MFNVVAFALVEIPLVAYLVAPDETRASDGRGGRLDPVASSPRRCCPAGRGRLRLVAVGMVGL